MADSSSQNSSYQAGACNIGPAEIRRRRNSGLLMAGFSLLMALVMMALGVWPLTRFLIAAPVASAAVGFLQARFHFCAGFGLAGVYNFGAPGTTHQVEDDAAREADRRRSLAIFGGALLIGAGVGLAFALLPL